MHPFTLLTLALTVVPSLAFPLETRDPQCSAECQTDGLVFHTPLPQFLEAKRKRQPSNLDWSDNGCSIPLLDGSGLDVLGDFPSGFNFLDSCKRHDFGYGNYRIQNRCNEDNRGKIDEVFKQDMQNECNKYDKWWQIREKTLCHTLAVTYYKAVRAGGSCHRP